MFPYVPAEIDMFRYEIQVAPLQFFSEGPLEISGVTITGNTLVNSCKAGGKSPVAPGPLMNVKGVIWSRNTCS